MASRYSGLCSDFNKYNYHIFGCGAIGSSAAIAIAKMNGRHFALYDSDIVGEENLGLSMYDGRHVGNKKVDSLGDMITDLYLIDTPLDIDYNIEKVHRWVTLSTPLPIPNKKNKDFAILGFDNMLSRLQIAESCFDHGFEYVIDARMGAEQLQIYTCKTIEEYKEKWYPDNEASTDPCTSKGTSYCSMLAGSMIASQIRKIISSQPFHKEFVFHIPSLTIDVN